MGGEARSTAKPAAMKGHTWTEVQWGVLYNEGSRWRTVGHVEYSGIRPGGEIGPFNEADCRYIASHWPNRSVVRRVVVHTRTEFYWEAV